MRLFIFFICITYGTLGAKIPSTESLQYPQIKQVVIWGHKLHSHTHSYIHNAFFRAFEFLGYKTLWLDDTDDTSSIDFTASLFITEGQVDTRIPLRKDCWYILHNCDDNKYKDLYDNNRCLLLQVYTHKCKNNNPMYVEDYVYYDATIKMLYMPWATDLLPHEIDAIKENVPTFQKTKEIWFVGTVGGNIFGNINEMTGFVKAAQQNGFIFRHILTQCSIESNIHHIQQSLIAPTIVGTWQLKEGYIPCRIFKNISYGNWGVTNSKTVYEFFNKKIVFNEDTEQLFYDALDHVEKNSISQLYELMDFVRDNHTYLNRIKHLLSFLLV